MSRPTLCGEYLPVLSPRRGLRKHAAKENWPSPSSSKGSFEGSDNQILQDYGTGSECLRTSGDFCDTDTTPCDNKSRLRHRRERSRGPYDANTHNLTVRNACFFSIDDELDLFEIQPLEPLQIGKKVSRAPLTSADSDLILENELQSSILSCYDEDS